MKKKLKIILGLLSILLIGIVVIISFIIISKEESFKEAYEKNNGELSAYSNKEYLEVNIDKNNKIEEITYADVLNKLENGENFVVFFGFPTCPWCRLIVEQLVNVSNNDDIETVYYVNIEDTRNSIEVDENGNLKTIKSGDEDYLKLIDNISYILNDYIVYDEEGTMFDTNMQRIFAPNIIVFDNKEAIYITSGVDDSISDPYSIPTDEQSLNIQKNIENVLKMIK